MRVLREEADICATIYHALLNLEDEARAIAALYIARDKLREEKRRGGMDLL